jgi:hypothetical protein
VADAREDRAGQKLAPMKGTDPVPLLPVLQIGTISEPHGRRLRRYFRQSSTSRKLRADFHAQYLVGNGSHFYIL